MRVVKIRLDVGSTSEDIELLSMSYQDSISQGDVFDVAIIFSPSSLYQSLLESLSLDSKTVVVNVGLSPLSEGELALLLATTLFKNEGSLELFDLKSLENETIDKAVLSDFYRLKSLFLQLLDKNEKPDFLIRATQCKQAIDMIDGVDGPLSANISRYLNTLARIYKAEHRYTMQVDYEGIGSINSKEFFSYSLELSNILKSLNGDESFFNDLLERKKFFELGMEACTDHIRDKTKVNLALKYTAWTSVLFLKLSYLYKKNHNYQLALVFLIRHLEEYLKTFLSAYSPVEYDSYGNFRIDGKKVSGVGSYMKEIGSFTELNLKEGKPIFDFVNNAINYRNDFVLGHSYKLCSLTIFNNHSQSINNLINALEAEIPEKYYTLSKNNKTVIGSLNVSNNFEKIIETVYS
jgi:hypothetical protein